MKNMLRIIILGVILCLLYSTSLFAQVPYTLWTKVYGGTGSDYVKSGQQTTDGGYVFAGSTNSFGVGGYDVWLVKTEANGDTLWTKTYGGADWEAANSVYQTTDNGYIIAGYTESFGAGAYDVYLIKTDANGDTLWTKTHGGTGSDEAFSVRQTTDGGYILAGYTGNSQLTLDVYLIKTDVNGDTLWTKTYGWGNRDIGYSVWQTTDNGYIIAGMADPTESFTFDVYLIKTDVNGDTLWTKTYGGTSSDYGYSVQQTADDGYVIAGYTESYGAGSSDVYLIKTDASGNTLWTKTYGGTSADQGKSVDQTTDGGYVISGYTSSFGAGGRDIYVIKTDASGDTLRTRTYGEEQNDEGWAAQQTLDSDYIVIGTKGSLGPPWDDGWLLKIGESTLPVELSAFTASYDYESGYTALSWTTASETDVYGFNVYRSTEDEFEFAERLNRDIIAGHGTTTEMNEYSFRDEDILNIGTTYYYWLESIDYSGISRIYSKVAQITIPDPSTNPPDIEIPTVYDFKVVPNPVNANPQFKFTLDKEAVVSVSIYNLKGELIRTLPSVMAEEDVTGSISWNGKDNAGKELSSGVYFYNLKINNNISEMKKFMVIK